MIKVQLAHTQHNTSAISVSVSQYTICKMIGKGFLASVLLFITAYSSCQGEQQKQQEYEYAIHVTTGKPAFHTNASVTIQLRSGSARGSDEDVNLGDISMEANRTYEFKGIKSLIPVHDVAGMWFRWLNQGNDPDSQVYMKAVAVIPDYMNNDPEQKKFCTRIFCSWQGPVQEGVREILSLCSGPGRGEPNPCKSRGN